MNNFNLKKHMYSNSVVMSNDGKSVSSKRHMKYLKGKIKLSNTSFIDESQNVKVLDPEISKDEL